MIFFILSGTSELFTLITTFEIFSLGLDFNSFFIYLTKSYFLVIKKNAINITNPTIYVAIGKWKNISEIYTKSSTANITFKIFFLFNTSDGINLLFISNSAFCISLFINSSTNLSSGFLNIGSNEL